MVRADMQSPLLGITPEFASINHPVWDEIAPELTPADFNRPYEMDVAFLRLLSSIRRESGVPFYVLSDARTSGGATNSAHNSRPCRAADLQVYNARQRGAILVTAVRQGVVRLGIYPGRDRRQDSLVPERFRQIASDMGGIHIDASDEDTHTSPAAWTRY